MDDDTLLDAILALEPGDIAHVIQAASENEGDLAERLAKGYYELTNNEPID